MRPLKRVNMVKSDALLLPIAVILTKDSLRIQGLFFGSNFNNKKYFFNIYKNINNPTKSLYINLCLIVYIETLLICIIVPYFYLFMLLFNNLNLTIYITRFKSFIR